MSRPLASFGPGAAVTAAEAMQLAIREGRKGAGRVSPNPLVGCTILDRDNRILAVGYHRRLGQDHAEIDAVKKISDVRLLRGAHAFVTLEPCAHQGRTPSCARKLAEYELGSVTYAVSDPNPVAQGGATILAAAGTPVFHLRDRADIEESERLRLSNESEDLAEIFLNSVRSKEPFIAVKIASSLDGQMAMKSGESKWITGEIARNHVQAVRARYDAVAVGGRTVLTDDPSLNIRHKDYADIENRAVVIDPRGNTFARLASSKLLRVRAANRVIVVVGRGVARKNTHGVRVIEVERDRAGDFLIEELLLALRAEGLSSILVEGGAFTIGRFFDARKVSRLHCYLAPMLLGGRHGLAWNPGFGGKTMAEKIRLMRTKRRRLGDDLYWTARIGY